MMNILYGENEIIVFGIFVEEGEVFVIDVSVYKLYYCVFDFE